MLSHSVLEPGCCHLVHSVSSIRDARDVCYGRRMPERDQMIEDPEIRVGLCG
jgi:hypothetical protein